MFGLEEIIKMNRGQKEHKSAQKIRDYFLPQYANAKVPIQRYKKNEAYTRKEDS